MKTCCKDAVKLRIIPDGKMCIVSYTIIIEV